MTAPPADVAIDATLAAAVVAEQLPDLDGLPVRPLGQGWDHALFAVGDAWVLRLPRRRGRVAWLRREARVLELVGAVLGALVPRFERWGAPSARFPYPFVAYRRLPGAPVEGEPGRGLAAELGRFLGRLHAVDPSACPPTPERWEDDPPDAAARELARVSDLAYERLSPTLREAAAPYLAAAVPAPPACPVRRLAHNDLCAEHVLVDASGTLRGVVDFGDAMVTDPVVDFVGLLTVGTTGFVRDVAAAYPLVLDDGFWTRFGWVARTTTLTWLAEAAASGTVEPRHLAWVARAFDGAAT